VKLALTGLPANEVHKSSACVGAHVETNFKFHLHKVSPLRSAGQERLIHGAERVISGDFRRFNQWLLPRLLGPPSVSSDEQSVCTHTLAVTADLIEHYLLQEQAFLRWPEYHLHRRRIHRPVLVGRWSDGHRGAYQRNHVHFVVHLDHLSLFILRR
jgi:hypothetical protein